MLGIKFKHTVLRVTSPLVQQGYEPGEQRHNTLVLFWKAPLQGVRCEVEFQLLRHHVAPVREFNVWLFRRRLADLPELETRYSPLGMSLPNLMRDLYGLNVFPPGKFHWEFTDEQSLLRQLTHAQSLLINYGIGWLEDPRSNIKWVKRRRYEKKSTKARD